MRRAQPDATIDRQTGGRLYGLDSPNCRQLVGSYSSAVIEELMRPFITKFPGRLDSRAAKGPTSQKAVDLILNRKPGTGDASSNSREQQSPRSPSSFILDEKTDAADLDSPHVRALTAKA